MKVIITLGLLAAFSSSAFPNGDDWTRQQNKKVRAAAEKQEQQRMERPSSTPIGGSRSGELEIEKDQDEQLRREAEKQKFLYEYEDNYRKGF